MSAGFDNQARSGVQAGIWLRASDAERDATAAELREHYAAGRLSLDELNERISRAFAAKTRGDLSAVMHDLPSLRPGGAPLPGSGQPSSGAGWTGQGRWHDTGWHQHAGSDGPGRHGPSGLGQAIGVAIASVVALGLLTGFGVMAVTGTGVGGSRPIAIIVVLAAFALLRRLLFGRARRGRTRRVRTGRGPHRRR
jgi:Flp pilus assembly protein TadB